MNKSIAAAAAVLLMGLSGCGARPDRSDEPADPSATGQVQLNLIGSSSSDPGATASVIIRSVLDHSQAYLIECPEKDHVIEGELVCDELTILPAGPYEVIVQPSDENAVPEQEWYRITVEPGETVELTMRLQASLRQ